jgi:PAS domain S-box-containing protein
MTEFDDHGAESPPGLRQRAEAALSGAHADAAGLAGSDLQRLVHNLRVHQIELEMQNEELRRAQLELAQSRDRLTDLYDFAPIGYLTLDPRLTILEANLTAAALLGTERARLLGKRFTAFVTRESQDALYHGQRAALGSDDKQTCELVLRRGDGSICPVQMDLVGLEDAPRGTRLLRCVVGDISERKRVEERRRAEERLWLQLRLAHAIAGCAGDSIFVLDGQGRITFANAAAERVFGYGSGALTGQVLHDRLHHSYPDGRRYPLDDCPTCRVHGPGETVRADECLFFRQDGTPVAVACANTSLEVDGEHLGAVLVAHDITSHKHAEHKLQEADRRKNEFLAILAHELRNPLAPIRNAVGIINMAGGSDPALQTARGIIERQLQHMVRLIDDLLDVSRITRGKLNLCPVPVALGTVLDQALEASAPNLEGLTLTVALPPEPVYVAADPLRLAQVFLNLLNNSCKYTRKGGSIRLCAERDGGEVVVTVSDTGVGIPPERLPGVFEMFSQAGSPPDQAQGGLGIGLALARALVELHGGAIEARSEGPGRGCVFVVRLPILGEAPVAPPQRSDEWQEPVPAAALRILVADDNRDSAESLALLLRVTGYEVETAHDGLEAVKAAARRRPDVVLLDIGMPKLDGYAACRCMRAQTWGKDMAIFALTGWGQDEDRRRSTAAGFDGHLVKPVEPAALLGLLKHQGLHKG